MEVPADIRSFVDKSLFQDSQSYNRDIKYFSILKGAVDFILQMASLYLQLLAFLWENDFILSKLGLDPNSEVYRSYVVFILSLILSTICNTPWSYYKTFVINQKHGLNNSTIKLFIMDIIKGQIISIILILILTPIFVKIMEYGGENFYIYMFIFIVIFTFIMLWVVPNIIMPLFNKYEELEEGDLKTKIYELTSRLNFPLK